MTTLISTDRVHITQKNFQQILIRGDGKDKFNQIINKEISLQPPSKNLEIKTGEKFIFAKKLQIVVKSRLSTPSIRDQKPAWNGLSFIFAK